MYLQQYGYLPLELCRKLQIWLPLMVDHLFIAMIVKLRPQHDSVTPVYQ